MSHIFDEVEEEFKDKGVNREQIKEVYYYMWESVKKYMQSTLIPYIRVPFLCSFKPQPVRLSKYLDFIDDPEEKKALEDIIDRLVKEQNKRKRK